MTETRLFDAPAEERTHPMGGTQLCYEFPNGWGASVVRSPYSYGGEAGLWEVAVTEGAKGRLRYDTPITNDVLGWLTEAEVEETLARIAGLDERTD